MQGKKCVMTCENGRNTFCLTLGDFSLWEFLSALWFAVRILPHRATQVHFLIRSIAFPLVVRSLISLLLTRVCSCLFVRCKIKEQVALWKAAD